MEVVSTSYDSLTLYRLIEKTVLGQTDHNGVQPRTWFLRIQARQSVQPTVVRAVQYKGGRRRSNWREPTT